MYIDIWAHMCRIVDVLPVRQTDETWILLVFIHRMHRDVLTVMRDCTTIHACIKMRKRQNNILIRIFP